MNFGAARKKKDIIVLYAMKCVDRNFRSSNLFSTFWNKALHLRSFWSGPHNPALSVGNTRYV